MSETPNTVHGRLLEAAHISGYTAKRAVTEMEWLLEDDRWREVGPGFENINDFLGAIDLSEFKLAFERRKPLVKRLTELQATQAATGAAIGVSRQTINSDVKKLTPAPFQIPAAKVAEGVEKQAKRKKREADLGGRREKKEAEARRRISESGSAYELVVADIKEWRPNGVSAVITDPPYVGDSLPLYEALRDFAVDVLPDGAPLVVMTWQAILPGVIDALRHEQLAYRWCICWRYDNMENTVDHARRVFDCWKPVLVYHKGSMPSESRMFRDEIANTATDKEHHEWGQSVDGFERLVTSFSEAGELVCDPFLGAGTTAMAALSNARRFIGCDVDAAAVETARGRLPE